LDEAAALQKHLEEKETATTKAEQELAAALVELRTQLLAHLSNVQAASGDRQRLLDQKKLTKSLADTLNVKWGVKKEGDKQESSVPASLGKQQRELNKLKEDWDAAQAAVATLQAEIEEEGKKANLLEGHISDLSDTQDQVAKFAKALGNARAAFKNKNAAIKPAVKKAGKGSKQSEPPFNCLDDLVPNYVDLLGFLQQMEMHVSAVLLHAEKEFAEDPLLAALAPLKEQMDGLAEPAGSLLDQLLAAQFALDSVRGTLDDIQANLIELEEEMNGSDALLTSFSKLKLNGELSSAKKVQDTQIAGLEDDLAQKEKEEAKAEEVYEKAQATFDFEMMLTDA
jgi:chromosome segregation ATPase